MASNGSVTNTGDEFDTLGYQLHSPAQFISTVMQDCKYFIEAANQLLPCFSEELTGSQQELWHAESVKNGVESIVWSCVRC